MTKTNTNTLRDINKRYGDYLRDIQIVCAQNDIPAYFEMAMRNTANLNEKHCMVIHSPDHERQARLYARFDEVGSWHTPEFTFVIGRDGAANFYNGQRLSMSTQRGEDTFPALFNAFLADFSGKEALSRPLISLEERLRNERIAKIEKRKTQQRFIIS